MKLKTLTVPFILIVMMISIVALIQGNKTNLADDLSPKSSLEKDVAVPEFVIYGFLFKKVAILSKKTSDLRIQGKIGDKKYHPLRKEAALSESQALTLEGIAADCQRALARQDEEAAKIMRAFREKFPPGKMPKGTRLPPPPQELITMAQQRNAIILKARDQVRLAFGELAFAQFDKYAKSRYQN